MTLIIYPILAQAFLWVAYDAYSQRDSEYYETMRSFWSWSEYLGGGFIYTNTTSTLAYTRHER